MKLNAAVAEPTSGRRGEATRLAIIEAARQILMTAGYAKFSMRRVAAQAGISVGNLQYYFSTKDQLTAALLDEVIEGYLFDFEAMRQSGTAEEQLARIVRAVFEDLQTPETTVFFPEIWSLANHEPSLTKPVDAMYARYRAVLAELAMAINPKLSAERARQLSVFICSSMEGHTVFIGHDKPLAGDLEAVIDMGVRSFLGLIREG
jgi:AcrR family transcriptional regulator